MQGAGGVGGLLAIGQVAGTATDQMVCIDGNGNIMALVDAALSTSAAIKARYTYDAFGQKNRAYGVFAATNPFGFSSKYEDSETGLLYYGYRFYDPAGGRWLSRDPIGEEGGLNLYGFVGNNGVSQWDYLGQFPQWAIAGIVEGAIGIALDSLFLPNWLNDTIIDSYGGPDAFLNATERALRKHGSLPRDLFRKARDKDKSPVDESTELGARLQSKIRVSPIYKKRRDFIIKRLKEGTSHSGHIHIDFQEAKEASLGHSIGGAQLYYDYDSNSCGVHFFIKDTYGFSAKGHMWERLQDKGYLVTFPVDIYVETSHIEGGAANER